MRKLAVLLFVALSAQVTLAYGSASCLSEAHDRTPLNLEQLTALCQDASSTAPLECYFNGRNRTVLSQDQVVELCSHASNNEPVDCYLDSRMSGSLSQDEIIPLCKAF